MDQQLLILTEVVEVLFILREDKDLPGGTYNLTHNSSALRNTTAGYWAYWRIVNTQALCVRAAARLACIT